MIKFFLISLLVFIQSCSKPKTVLICGDHECVNKKEANQFFEENLSIEVKIIDNKKKKNIDLVELNLSESSPKKQITLVKKNKTKKPVKKLSKDEIKKIKKKVKKIEKNKRVVRKKTPEKESGNLKVLSNNEKFQQIKKTKKFINKQNNDLFDVCTILEKCSIDEISKYLIKKGKKKDFPDLTVKE